MSKGADRGSATVWALVTIAVLAAGLAVVVCVGTGVLTRHRADAAADVAALTAATHVLDGPAAACARARAAAAANGARLLRCSVRGALSVVTVERAAPPWLAWAGDVTSRAWAGPTSSYPKELSQGRHAS